MVRSVFTDLPVGAVCANAGCCPSSAFGHARNLLLVLQVKQASSSNGNTMIHFMIGTYNSQYKIILFIRRSSFCTYKCLNRQDPTTLYMLFTYSFLFCLSDSLCISIFFCLTLALISLNIFSNWKESRKGSNKFSSPS